MKQWRKMQDTMALNFKKGLKIREFEGAPEYTLARIIGDVIMLYPGLALTRTNVIDPNFSPLPEPTYEFKGGMHHAVRLGWEIEVDIDTDT